jgi:hypothetical protein
MLIAHYTVCILPDNLLQRYVKQQITKQLMDSDNEFITFVMVAGLCGSYSDCTKRAPVEVVFDFAENGNEAIVRRLDPLSSRELFLIVCEFLVKAGDRWTILKTLCSVSAEIQRQALKTCDLSCRPKLFFGKSSRTRKQVLEAEEDPEPLPTLPMLWKDFDINRKVPQSIITKLGGCERTRELYRKFMRDAQHLPRGLMLKRKRDPQFDEQAERLLELHASRDALSLAIVPMCGQVITEARRRVEPTYIAVCTTCAGMLTHVHLLR